VGRTESFRRLRVVLLEAKAQTPRLVDEGRLRVALPNGSRPPPAGFAVRLNEQEFRQRVFTVVLRLVVGADISRLFRQHNLVLVGGYDRQIEHLPGLLIDRENQVDVEFLAAAVVAGNSLGIERVLADNAVERIHVVLDVTLGAVVRHFPGGHRDERSLRPFDDAQILNG